MFAVVARIHASSKRCAPPLGAGEDSDMHDMNARAQVIEDEEQLATSRLNYRFELERRAFCKLLGGGLMVFLSAGDSLAQESGRRFRGEELPPAVSAWLHIAPDGSLTVYTGKVE